MGRVFLVELGGRAYRCRFCDSPLALADDILSRSFNCHQGRAYLFNNVVNITLGAEEERLMLSGMHTVEDIYCCCCGQILGWKYVAAHDKDQKYKEGKFVLERWRIADEIAQAPCGGEGSGNGRGANRVYDARGETGTSRSSGTGDAMGPCDNR